MNKMIIKGAGTIDEILTALNALRAVEGGETTLYKLGCNARYLRIREAVRKQFEENETEE